MKPAAIWLAAALTAIAMGVIGPPGAVAAEWEASVVPGEIEGHATSTQVFTASETSGGTVECEDAATSGTATKPASPTQKVTVEYTECSADGFPGVSVSKAEYEFNISKGATEGTAAVLNEIKDELFGCVVTVTSTENGALKTVEFANNANGTISEKTKVTGITDEVTGGGGLCGPETTNHNGTYTGTSEVGIKGGTYKVS